MACSLSRRVLAALLCLSVPVMGEKQADLMPYPKSVLLGLDTVEVLAASFAFTFTESVEKYLLADHVALLSRATTRYQSLTFPSFLQQRYNIFENHTGFRKPVPVPTHPGTSLAKLEISIKASVAASAEANKTSVYFKLFDDESYTLDVTTDKEGKSTATLEAATVWGILRGLETFSQLVQPSCPPTTTAAASDVPVCSHFIYNATVRIQDEPRFPWRGVLLDTSRHFIPVSSILHTLDAMAYNKLNTFHWHVSDAESFPFQLKSFPEVAEKGSFAKNAQYSVEEAALIVSYANDRGIRVLPEFDTPGHAAAIGQSHPELLADCWDWEKKRQNGHLMWPAWDNFVLDTTRNETLAFVSQMWRDVADVFPDEFVHLGGDEVPSGCWNAVESIRKWMQDAGAKFSVFNETTKTWAYDWTNLQARWTSQLSDFTNHQLDRRNVLYQEAFYAGGLSNSSVVHVWKDHRVHAILEQKLPVVMSRGWYMDATLANCSQANPQSCNIPYDYMLTWKTMYAIDPLGDAQAGDDLTLIWGGEIASWSENQNEMNLDTRIWDRAPAVAERLWSSAELTSANDAQMRFSHHRCRMLTRGVMATNTESDYCPLSPRLSKLMDRIYQLPFLGDDVSSNGDQQCDEKKDKNAEMPLLVALVVIALLLLGGNVYQYHRASVQDALRPLSSYKEGNSYDQ